MPSAAAKYEELFVEKGCAVDRHTKLRRLRPCLRRHRCRWSSDDARDTLLGFVLNKRLSGGLSCVPSDVALLYFRCSPSPEPCVLSNCRLASAASLHFCAQYRRGRWWRTTMWPTVKTPGFIFHHARAPMRARPSAPCPCTAIGLRTPRGSATLRWGPPSWACNRRAPSSLKAASGASDGARLSARQLKRALEAVVRPGTCPYELSAPDSPLCCWSPTFRAAVCGHERLLRAR